MDKCHIIIVDTVNCKRFNGKNVKNTLCEILTSDSNFLNNECNYLTKNIEFFDLDKNCDKIAIEKALLKEHLFINIISSSIINSVDKDVDDDYYKKFQNNIQHSLSFRHFNLFRHAFISKNRNTLFLSLDEDFFNPTEITKFPIEINWMGIQSEICQDQLVNICSGHSHEKKLQIWLLSKLIALDGNFSFYCFPILSKLINLYNGIIQLKTNSFDSCESSLSMYYTDLVKDKISIIDKKSNNSFTTPIFIHADKVVDWTVIKKCINDKFSSDNTFIGHYNTRIHPICQDINFLLVSLLRYFKIFPKDNQLNFTTTQMATLVSDCLRTKSTVQDGKSLIIFIEDIDWIASSSLTNEACSWLPEKCAPNIHIIISASKDSVHEKSLKCRLSPPTFIDVSFPDSWTNFCEDCNCQQMWCLTKLLCCSDKLENVIAECDNKDVQQLLTKLVSIFTCSVVCQLTYSQIEWILAFDNSTISTKEEICIDEKDQSELSEKVIMNSHKQGNVTLIGNDTKNVANAIDVLIDCGIISQLNLNPTSESCYALTVPQLSKHISEYLNEFTDPKTFEFIKCRLGAYFVYQTTNLHMEMVFVPSLLQYLSGVKDTTLKDWLLNWPVLMKLRDEFCVPVRLLSLWRALLGPNTDYKPMINAYITTCLPDKRDLGDCCNCKKSLNIELQQGPISLNILRQSSSDFSKAYSKYRCRILLDLARISMQVGQYAVAKEMARGLLKQLDQLSNDNRSFTTIFDSNQNLLASCLHLLFCTLDERLKTFEFVTEQTTPIFRRTVHYGARALLLQHDIVCHINKTIDNNNNNNNNNNHGDGDGRVRDCSKLQQQLCHAEIRLAHIMTHFVFSLDGVEQTVINRHFMPSEIRSVTHACMSKANDIANKLKDRQLLLEIQMTFGVIQPRENFKEKILLYKTPLRQALCIYGEGHIFVSRLYINIGISYEEQKKYIKAFEYFTLWSHVTHELLGRNHCKSLRSCGVFKEPIFKVTADFLKNLNDEEPNESLEEELSDSINNIDVDNIDIQGISISGVGIGNPQPNSAGENMSFENMFMMRNTLEHESDWEIHSSDDETPNYTTAFEEVIEKFKKRSSASMAKELLQSILQNSLIDPDDLSKEDIDCLIRSQESSNDNDSIGGPTLHNVDNNVSEAFRITRMFRDLRELAQWIPSTNLSPSDISLSRRLLELQRELEEFLDN